MMKSSVIALVIVMVVAVMVVAPRPALAAPGIGVTTKEILLGGTNAITGVAAAACIGVQYGGEATFQAVNKAGGVNGRKITYTVLDDAYSPQRALANVRRLVESTGVLAMFGGCGTPTAMTVLNYAVENGVPYLFPYAGLDALTHPVKPTIFAIMPLYADQVKGMTPYLFGQFKPKTYSMVLTNVPGYKDLITVVRAAAPAAGVKELTVKAFEPGMTDVAPLVLELKQANPDLLVLSAIATDGARFLQEMARQNWFPKVITGTSTLTDQVFLQAAGDLANDRVVAPGFSVPASDPKAKACNDELAAYKPDFRPSQFTLFGCVSARVLVEALRRAGKDLTRESLIVALNGLKNFETGLTPPVSFDAGNHMGLSSIMPIAIRKGEFVVAGPPIKY
jgi:branched-chain amino acid transport system substrate-binding protein